MTTHFMEGTEDRRNTLCGKRWEMVVWGNDPKAQCEQCCDEHARRTNWSFPLPEVVE